MFLWIITKNAGITAILGLGASPGLTNILAYMAMLELDDISKVYTGWICLQLNQSLYHHKKGLMQLWFSNRTNDWKS